MLAPGGSGGHGFRWERQTPMGDIFRFRQGTVMYTIKYVISDNDQSPRRKILLQTSFRLSVALVEGLGCWSTCRTNLGATPVKKMIYIAEKFLVSELEASEETAILQR